MWPTYLDGIVSAVKFPLNPQIGQQLNFVSKYIQIVLVLILILMQTPIRINIWLRTPANEKSYNAGLFPKRVRK